MGNETKSIKPVCKRDSELFSFFIVLAIAVSAICLLSALAPPTAADGLNLTESWNKTFGGTATDKGYSAQQTTDGGYIIAGETYSYGAGDVDIWLIKTDSNGNELWHRTFGGAEADNLDRGSVRQTSDGGYIITGYTKSFAVGDEADVWLIKTDANGIELWDRTFSGAGLSWGHSVQQTPDGGYIIAGRTIPQEGARADAWLIKTNASGTEEWNRTFGTDACEYAASVQRTVDGGYIMTGRTTSYGAGEADVWLIKTDSDGNEEWNKTFGGATYDYGYSVRQTTDGGYVIAGSTNGRNDIWLIKTDSNGTEDWTSVFGGLSKDEGYSVQQTADGGYIVTGYTSSYGTAGSADVWLIKTDSGGNEEWNMTPGGAGDDRGCIVQQTADDGYIVAGYTNSFGAGSDDVWLIKLSQPGAEVIDLLTVDLQPPGTVYATVRNTISATIKNQGDVPAGSFNVSLSVDGEPVDKTRVSGMAAGETTSVSFSWTPSRIGTFELCVLVDCDSEVVEADETNNIGCEDVAVLSFSQPCWTDTFVVETKIAEHKNVKVEDGDIKHDVKLKWIWESDSLLVSGLGGFEDYPAPAVAYNITGDGRWHLIYADEASHKKRPGVFHGYYWDGTQWISEPSLVAGLEDILYKIVPAIAYNITGDGRWNLISGENGGGFYGYYWNGTQWISDSSLVAGLGDIGRLSAPAIAYNVTGDGRWNLIAGEHDGVFYGYYWNGTQWLSDSSLVAGLGDIGKISAPAIAYNATGDGSWNLISGENGGGFYGYYWNGSQWISNSSVSFGLGGGNWNKLVIGFNITGDREWNLIDGTGHGGVLKGFRYRGGFIDTGRVKTVAIQPSLAYFKDWAVFKANATIPDGTDITYKILDASGSTIMTVVDGQNISGITQKSIRLYAELTTSNISYTPVLHDWGVCWATGKADLVPTAIETPSELYANVSVVSAVIENKGVAHSGAVVFNVTLCANDIEVDSKRIVVGDMPPGWSKTVTFFGWTPQHAGNYTLRVIVDSADEIEETDEGNNERTKEVTVLSSIVRRLTFDSSSSINPSVATDSAGNIHIVWSENRGGWLLYYKKLSSNGTVLVNDKMVCPGSGPKVAVDPTDSLHVVFTREYDGMYMKLDNNGTMLMEAKQIISGLHDGGRGFGTHPAEPAGIAVDSSGNVHVLLWRGITPFGSSQDQGNKQDLNYIKLDTDGNKLVNHTIEYLERPIYGRWDCMDMPSGIAVDSADNAYFAYSNGRCSCTGTPCSGCDCFWPSCQKVYYVKIDSEGVHKQELTGELPLPSQYPAVCIDSGDNKYVVWSQHNRTATFVPASLGRSYRILYGFDFYLVKFDKSGNKIVDSKRLTFEDYPVEMEYTFYSTYEVKGIRKPVIDTESGVIHVAWTVPVPKTGEGKDIWYMAFDTSGNIITNVTLSSFEDGDSCEPDIDAVQDGAHLLWTDNRDGNNEIYYVKTELPGNIVFLICPPDDWAPRNVTKTYTIGVMHTMPGRETLNLTIENIDAADVAELSESTISLDPNTMGEVTLNVTDAEVGDYRVRVRAESQTNPAINAEHEITTSVIVPKLDLMVKTIDVYHNDTTCSPWQNISNEVDVTVGNIGTEAASSFYLCLYADDELVDRQEVAGLARDSETTVQLHWTPAGADCFGGCTYINTCQEYELKAVADCTNALIESDEENNEKTMVAKACYNGYIADEPLESFKHGTLRGGIIFTTGDGTYTGLYSPGATKDVHYETTLPDGATVKLARLNVYYTWTKPDRVCPEIEVSVTNASGTYVLSPEKRYNDIKCQGPGGIYVYTWGNYIYNLTDYVTGSGTYTITVANSGSGKHSFCIAAPGIVLLYEDETAPLIEYWLNEGADVLLGGRRPDGGFLGLEECINNATFEGSIEGTVKNATLGVVAPWAGQSWQPGQTNYLNFNGIELGQGVYHDEKYTETMGGITVILGAKNAQVGVNVSDVTDYLKASDNVVSQVDYGDNMMPTNAFLVVEYTKDSIIKVNKSVWSALNNTWLEKTTAELNDRLRFRCVIKNAGEHDLTNISAVDILPDSQNYSGDATVDGIAREPDWTAGNQFGWNFSEPLAPSENITIEFDATVKGTGTNTLKVSAWCSETNDWFLAEDCVHVTIPELSIPKPSFIYGWVNHSDGSQVSNPNVAITNTAKIFVADTSENSNYYQVMVRNVSVGDELHFRATDNGRNSTEFSHALTQEELNAGGIFNFNITLKSEQAHAVFDTGEGTGPSIFGTHRGTITPNQTLEINKLYTYTCADMVGHSEYVEIYNDSFYIDATWDGYSGDYYNITFPSRFALLANHTYNYTIRTGSYPQIIHAKDYEAEGGIIFCEEFIDVNGERYDDWIPAIRLWYS